MIREGNIAAAVALNGGLLGFVIPLASVIAHSATLVDLVAWGVVALVVQLGEFLVARVLLMPHLPQAVSEEPGLRPRHFSPGYPSRSASSTRPAWRGSGGGRHQALQRRDHHPDRGGGRPGRRRQRTFSETQIRRSLYNDRAACGGTIPVSQCEQTSSSGSGARR